MEAIRHETPRGTVSVRRAAVGDIPELIEIHKRRFPLMAGQEVAWSEEQLACHQHLFPEGQIVAEISGKLVGAVASLIVHMGENPYRAHTHAGITDGGYFQNHNPNGDTLYAAGIHVDLECRGMGIGSLLCEACRQLCKRLNLRRIVGGGQLQESAEHADPTSVDPDLRAAGRGEIRDSVLSFLLHEGFVPRGILRHYVTGPCSRNHASLIEWLNPDHVPAGNATGKVRVACAQYRMRRIECFGEFAGQVEYFIEAARGYHADFIVLPEFFSMQLLSQPHWSKLPAPDAVAALADMEPEILDLLLRMARKHNIHIIGGSQPVRRNDKLLNVCPIVCPDGTVHSQPKLHITPSEVESWGITGGDELRVIDTPKARIGVLICYDSEFPETARHLADQGAEILFVPYCTDDRSGYQRVRVCSQARAIENQVYVVTAGIVGNLPGVQGIDIHYGKAGIFTPSDFGFARDGIQAEADGNLEMLLVSDLDLHELHRNRTAGSVRPRLDRRRDLFEYRSHLQNHLPATGDASAPTGHTDESPSAPHP